MDVGGCMGILMDIGGCRGAVHGCRWKYGGNILLHPSTSPLHPRTSPYILLHPSSSIDIPSTVTYHNLQSPTTSYSHLPQATCHLPQPTCHLPQHTLIGREPTMVCRNPLFCSIHVPPTQFSPRIAYSSYLNYLMLDFN